jgi:hypothetical protein
MAKRQRESSLTGLADRLKAYAAQAQRDRHSAVGRPQRFATDLKLAAALVKEYACVVITMEAVNEPDPARLLKLLEQAAAAARAKHHD